MSRRRKSSPLEDVFELVSMFPWWGGVIAALLSYALLHSLARPAGPAAGQVMVAALAGVFQSIIPLICLAAAVVSWWKASQRKALVQNVTHSSSASSLEDMSWQEFEALVGEAFRQKGYKVLELGGSGPDGGVDLVLTRGNERFLVQCKQWKAFKVGVAVVRELYGVMASKGAAGGFVVTSGKFTADAHEFARGRNVTLVAGDQLFAMLQAAKAGRKMGTGPTALQTSAATPTAPACPVCGSLMVRRIAKSGSNAGTAFLGCSTFPKCRGIVKI